MHICTYGSMSEKSIKDKAKKKPRPSDGVFFCAVLPIRLVGRVVEDADHYTDLQYHAGDAIDGFTQARVDDAGQKEYAQYLSNK